MYGPWENSFKTNFWAFKKSIPKNHASSLKNMLLKSRVDPLKNILNKNHVWSLKQIFLKILKSQKSLKSNICPNLIKNQHP